MNGTQNKVMVGMVVTTTVIALAGVVTANLVPKLVWPLPDDAAIIDPFSGEVATVSSEDDQVGAAAVADVRKSPPTASKRSFVDPILKRNIFDSTKVGQESATEDGGDAGAKSALPVTLIATIVSDPEQFSSCLIGEEKGEGGALGYGIGDMVLGEATIHRIEQRRVILKRTDGELEYLEMDGADAVQPPSAKAAKASKNGKWDGVEKASETKFTIDQETFDKILENPDKLAGQIRAVPHTDESGKVDGYRLSGIRRSSLFRKLGIKNGDVVHSVNGNGLTTMSSALSAFESLQNERNFNFEVTSRKKKKTYEYEVR